MRRSFAFLFVLLLLLVAYQLSPLQVSVAVEHLAEVPDVAKKDKAKPVKTIPVATVAWPDAPKPAPVKPSKQKKKPTVTSQKAEKTERHNKNGQLKGGKGEGFDVVGRFECSVDFYVRAMRNHGALVMAYDSQHKRFIEITAAGNLAELAGFPAGYSSLTRRLTDDYPHADQLFKSVTKRWGQGHYDILLVLPQSFEISLDQNLKRKLDGVVVLADVSRLYVTYRQSEQRLVMAIERAQTGTKSVRINRHLVL